MINRTKVKESTQIKPGDNGDVLVMKDNAPEWSTPSDAGLAEQANVDSALAEKQDKLTAGDNIKIEDNVISAASKPTPINIGTVTEGETAMVSNSGTDTDVVLNFVLPKGDKGDTGSQGPQGDPGPKGDPGEPFQIRKIYSSVDEMEADYNNPGIEEGDFVLIDTDDISDPDNAKIYVKGPTGWQFVTDLSGAQGIQGPQGDPGTPAGFGNITATVDNTTGTPQVSVQADGPNTAKNISFSFTGLRGEKGEKGDPGQDGTQVNNLAPLVVDTAPTSANSGSVTIGNGAISSGTNGAGIAIGKNAYSGTNGGTVIGVNARGDDNQGGGVVIGDYAFGTRGVNIGSHASVRPTSMPDHADSIGSYAEVPRSASSANDFCVALGSYSVATEGKTVSVGSGATTLTLSDDMTEEQQAIARAAADVPTRRIVNVTDPRDAQDAATKNYVDTKISEIPTEPTVNIINKPHVDSPLDAADFNGIAIGYNFDPSQPAKMPQGEGVLIGSAYGLNEEDSNEVLMYEGGLYVNNSTVFLGSGPVPEKSITIGRNHGYAAGGGTENVCIGPGGVDVSGSMNIAIGTNAACNAEQLSIAMGANCRASGMSTIAIGNEARTSGTDTIAIGTGSEANEDDTVSFGSDYVQRRIVHVADPQNAQDAATKNYVDTQLEPINAKLQYVPENTNQILSQIQTNVEKAQSAADAKVASITAGTGISVDASNPTAPVVSTTGLATQSDLTALQTTVAQLQQTVTQLQATIANLTLETERI